jgi:ankyrin repeat protein
LEIDDVELASFLVKHNAEINIPSFFMDEMLLFEAIKKGNLNFVQFLVESKADLYIKNRWSKNVMEIALEKNNPEIIAYLRSKGAMTKEDLNKREVERAKEMQQFGTIVREKKVSEIITLLNTYPEVVLGTQEQKSLVILCAEKGSVELLEICLERIHWNINDQLNFEQQSMLHIAAKQENKEFVVFLVKKGADFTQEDAFGKKPIEYAKNKEVKSYLKTLKIK